MIRRPSIQTHQPIRSISDPNHGTHLEFRRGDLQRELFIVTAVIPVQSNGMKFLKRNSQKHGWEMVAYTLRDGLSQNTHQLEVKAIKEKFCPIWFHIKLPKSFDKESPPLSKGGPLGRRLFFWLLHNAFSSSGVISVEPDDMLLLFL